MWGEVHEVMVQESAGVKLKNLWCVGEWRGEWGKGAAVVGSRRMTEYGRRVVEKLVPGLVDNKRVIVSGFMYGVDQYAHRVCLECGGRTVAVLGWGIEWPGVSREDEAFLGEIVKKGGLVVSEWRNQAPTLWTFPLRNRIVAALAKEVYVIEAAAKSGALITAGLAAKMGKKVWAVPGPITSRVSAGTNGLIARGEAEMWLPAVSVAIRSTNNTEISILLQNEALSVDDVVRRTGRSVDEVGAELTVMTLRGDVSEKNGKYYLMEKGIGD